MTRIFSFLAAATTAARLAFGGAAYAATANGGDGPGHPGGPNGGNAGGPASVSPRVEGCDFRADEMGLAGPARRTFLWRCQQGGAF